MADTRIDPYALLGKPETWGKFGEGENDAAADLERRQLAMHFAKRLGRADRKSIPHDVALANLMAGSSVGFAWLFMAAAGGPNGLPEDAFDRWISIMTFAWHQALECFCDEAGHA